MRDIKFRGKRLDTGEWIYGSLVKEFDGWSICDWSSPTYSRYDVDPDTVGQLIGRLHGSTDVYEDDVVRTDFNMGSGISVVPIYTGVIRYSSNGEYQIRIGILAQPLAELVRNKWRVDVIGNVHDNPELLA